jgi:hypothetical protein
MRTFIALPDMQVPYHDQKTIDLICSFAVDIGATDVLHVGDEIDAPSPSRWVRSKAGEFADTLQKDIDATRRVLAGIADTIQPNTFVLSRSNHGDRVRNYINEKAPALAPLRALEWAELMDFAGLGIDYKDKPYEFAKGWVLAHGDEGTMSRVPSQTAMNLARKWGKSTLVGHTHRLGLQHDNNSLNGRVTRHLFGVEVGHAMLLTKATYLRALSANWQQGCAVLEEDERGGITPYVIPIIDRTIRFQGEVWRG